MNNINNLKSTQLQLTSRIRSGVGELSGIESRRLNVYKELFFNNIEGFCSTSFPITKEILGTKIWTELVRSFFIEHACETPHFVEISQEFLSYLIGKQDDFEQLPFLSELAHYEWVELDLAVKIAELEPAELIPNTLVLSPFSTALLYNYPVHTISVDNYTSVSTEMTPLIVYRNNEFNIKFIRVDQLTVIMFQLIQVNHAISKTELTTKLMALNKTFTEVHIENFLAQSLPKFMGLGLIRTT